MTSASEPLAPSRLTVNSGALAANYKLLREAAGCETAGVIKANGYGTGSPNALETLKGAGCKHFFVATPEEALSLGTAGLYVLGGVYKGAETDYAAQGLIPVLNSLEEISRWHSCARRVGKKLPAIVHFDTAMNRLGLGAEETKKLIAYKSLLDGIDVRYIMSHFACSDENGHPHNEAQVQRFRAIAAEFPGVKASLANSSGIMRSKDWCFDLARPGYALYGGNPLPEQSNPMSRVVTLEARVLQIRTARRGETVGYGASHTFEKDTTLATLSLGYADGFLRSGSGTAKLFWNGQPCPVRGRVSMDLITVETGHLQNPPQTGDFMEVLGPHQSVDDLARAAGTTGYEILTSLSPRAKRVYTG